MTARANGFAAALAILAFGAACDQGPRTEGPAAENREPTSAVERAGDAVSDSRITTTVQGKYFASADVKGHEIDVDTRNGVVTLQGKVDNENARQQAMQIARSVDGVVRVDDQLTVMSDADRATARRMGEPDSRSPAWITTKIQSQYYLHPQLKPWNIDVTTMKDGVVVLSGEIESAADRAEAVKIAANTDGVARVEDHLRMKGEATATTGAADAVRDTAQRAGDATSDAWITTKIEARYFADPDVKGRNIDVDTNNGVVTLKGTVNSHSERNQAVAMARNTDGVRQVQDQLQISPATRDERGTAGRAADRAGEAADRTGQAVNDAWITMKIQSKYFAASDIKARKIDVDTRNGVVTLNGVVASPTAKEEAVHVARETDGVMKVMDKLRVDPSTK